MTNKLLKKILYTFPKLSALNCALSIIIYNALFYPNLKLIILTFFMEKCYN